MFKIIIKILLLYYIILLKSTELGRSYSPPKLARFFEPQCSGGLISPRAYFLTDQVMPVSYCGTDSHTDV